MDVKKDMFLPALKAALKNEKVSWSEELESQDWVELFRIATTHQVLPLIYEAVYDCPAARNMEPQVFMSAKQQTIRSVMLQTMKTNEFLGLFQHLQKAGVQALVVKGIVCRNLYPNPDYRMSGDEDVLIPEEEFELCHQAMLDYGMHPADPTQDIQSEHEVPYGKLGSPIYIELHKCLFPPESTAYGDLNRFFKNVHDRAIKLSIDGKQVVTMGYTDHLFYLICHAFKHFLHSGFGIRQVCDIVLFANAYGKEIDWIRILQQCREIHADLFTAALFQIGQKYLTFDPSRAGYPQEWQEIQVDEQLMLDDLLEAGIYGDGTMSRKHSSNITLNAVSSEKQGKKSSHFVIKTLFPTVQNMEGRYPYLKKHPYLLPIAWINRIWKYRKETQTVLNNDAAESIQIGNQRLKMMKTYGIIK
ncbi:MAG: nucleotidyltransferase family protein [Clostridiales bacterium]|nr:nucleotidyltransferase family protein [Clostridiales bacterium]